MVVGRFLMGNNGMDDSETPPPFLRVMDTTFNLIGRICIILAGLALVTMTIIFAWLVFGRYVLNDTPTWVEQVSLLLIMVISFLGAAVGVNQNTHLSVVIFRSIVPDWMRAIFVIVTDFLMLVFGGMMFWYGLELTQFKWNTLIPLIQVSEGYRSMPLTICGLFVFLFSAGHMIRFFLKRDEREDSIE